MNNEESRLRTFTIWPSDAAVDAERIAKAGFFYTGQGMEVQCFSCGGKISEWNYGDQVMAKHRRLDPNCPFVVNPATSGNVPKIDVATVAPSSSATHQDSETDYYNERMRLSTFESWPASHIIRPEALAEAGFYYMKASDKVKCAYCKGCAGNWEVGDDPKLEHRRLFPLCAFVLSNFNTNQAGLDNSKLVNAANLQELGIQQHREPKRPRYATVESRLNSFTFWPEDLIQTPEMLAEAGFYYMGVGDQVRCFHCDGGLRHWDPGDDPWVEHAKWFPACAFVRLIKGQDFIRDCRLDQPTQNHTRTIPSSHSALRHQSNGGTSVNHEISDSDLQPYMISTPALAALGLGLHEGRVKQAIRHRLQQTGTGFSSADDLIEEVLNAQLEEADSQNADDNAEDVSTIMSFVTLQHSENKPAEPAPSEVSKKPAQRAEPAPQVPKNLSLEEENRQLKEARLCKICMDNEIGVVFLPCGHLTTCVNCAPSLKDCPVCRSIIKGTVRTFLS